MHLVRATLNHFLVLFDELWGSCLLRSIDFAECFKVLYLGLNVRKARVELSDAAMSGHFDVGIDRPVYYDTSLSSSFWIVWWLSGLSNGWCIIFAIMYAILFLIQDVGCLHLAYLHICYFTCKSAYMSAHISDINRWVRSLLLFKLTRFFLLRIVVYT